MATLNTSQPAEPTSTETKTSSISTAEITPTSQQDVDPAVHAKASEILTIIQSYGLNHERTGTWEGFATFLPIVISRVVESAPILLLLPGFPFKSPNAKDKVLGVLPDLGEELALKHLDGLCESIKAVYTPGCECHVTSDGLVYNDLLGVTDETVWNFGQAVRSLSSANSLTNLSFLRLWDLLEYPGDFQNKDFYLANAQKIREELMKRFSDPAFEADMSTKSTEDMRMTHTKYLEFLAQDLAFHPRHMALSREEQEANIAETAKRMMGRWRAFSAAMAAVTTPYVRLSIHDSGGKDKLSMAVVPQREVGKLGATPWHSCCVVEEDGGLRTVQRREVDEHVYQIVTKEGRPYGFTKRPEGSEGSVDIEDVWRGGVTIRERKAVAVSSEV